ncbi:MAG: polyheme membrane-associated cytochrome C, partial [Pararhodobacter sp.]
MSISRTIRTLAASALVALLALPATSEDLPSIVDAWLASPHADHSSLSFTYWNQAGEVPQSCAACHSGPGFIDFLGADGSTPGVVDHPGPINSVIGCASCHTSAAHALDAVTLPSGVVLDGLGPNAVCTVCHSGRTSGDTVAAATGQIGDDTVSADLA